MEKLVCQRQGHEMPLDMICLNKTCDNKGLLCHKCFINIPHHHMSSDIVHTDTFLGNCQKAIDKACNSISCSGDREVDEVREEYNISKKMIEECKKKTLNGIREMYEELDTEISSNFEKLLDEVEGPKNVVLKDIDKFRTSLKEIQSGLIDDPEDMNNDIMSVWKVLAKNNQGGFMLKEEFCNKGELAKKEEKVTGFKNETDKLKRVVERIQEWVKTNKIMEELDQNKPMMKLTPKPIEKPAEKTVEKMEKIIEKPVEKIVEKVVEKPREKAMEKSYAEPVKKGMDMSMSTSLVGKKRSSPVEKEVVKGSSPYKKVKNNLISPLHNENAKNLRTITPARLESKDLNAQMSVYSQPQRRNYEQDLMFNKKEEVKEAKEIKEAKQTPDRKVVTRFTIDDKGYEHFRYLHTTCITFKTDRDILLLGFGHYMIFRPTMVGHFEYTLMEGEYVDQHDYAPAPPKEIRAGPFKLAKSQGNQKVMPILFENPVKIPKDQFYTLKILNKSKNIEFHCYKGQNGVNRCTPFTFFPSKFSDMAQVHTGTKKGQIPDFIFDYI